MVDFLDAEKYFSKKFINREELSDFIPESIIKPYI